MVKVMVIFGVIENREMSLSDGTFLVSPARYDYLVAVRETYFEESVIDC